MDHPIELHIQRLNSLCRLCGERSKKFRCKRKVIECGPYTSNIKYYCDLDISQDKPEQHSTTLCRKCYTCLVNLKIKYSESLKQTVLNQKAKASRLWKDVTSVVSLSDCAACSHFDKQFMCGRPKKAQNKGGKPNVDNETKDMPGRSCINSTAESSIASAADMSMPEIRNVFDPSTTSTPKNKRKHPDALTQDQSCVEGNTSEFTSPISFDDLGPGCSHWTPPRKRYMLRSPSRTPQKFSQSPTKRQCHLQSSATASVKPMFSHILDQSSSSTPHRKRQLSDDPTQDKACFEDDLGPGYSHLTPRKRYMLRSPSKTPQKCSKSPSKLQCHLESCATASDKPKTPCSIRSADTICLPFTKDEEALLTKMIRLKLQASEIKDTVALKTGGPPLYLCKIIKAKKSSHVVSSPTRRKRKRLNHTVRKFGSLDDKGELKQLGTEIQKATKCRKQLLLEQAGYHKTVKMSCKEALTFRTSVGMSYSQSRKQNKLLKEKGVKIPSEKLQRQLQQQLQLSEVKVEDIILTNTKGEKEATPLAYFSDLPRYVSKLLEIYDNKSCLTQHAETIPEDEIWLKLGGDYGGDTFKLMLQVANVEQPNSKHNTFLIAIVEGKDYSENLKDILQKFDRDLIKLQDMTWNGKQMRVFLFGDYDFLLKMYGISGATSKHPCLWCLATKEEIQHGRKEQLGNIKNRTLTSLKKDHQKFVKGGKKKAEAKKFNNVTTNPIWDIPLTQVVPPYLHILLGIVKRHHELLESECNLLDTNIAMDHAEPNILPSTSKLPPEFSQYVAQCRQKKEQEEEKRHLETIACLHTEQDYPSTDKYKKKHQQLEEDIWELEDNITELEEKKLAKFSGPVTSNLDKVLSENKIAVQAYHGRSFVGNHCHRYLQDPVQTNIFNSVIEQTKNLSSNPNTHAQAERIVTKFRKLNKLFSEVHCRVSKAQPLSSDPDTIQTAIDKYMAFYRQAFPRSVASVLPKHHLLEFHCVDFMASWRVQLGLMGEQGGEECHAVVNRIKARAAGMKNKAAKLAFILKEQNNLSHPALRQSQAKK